MARWQIYDKDGNEREVIWSENVSESAGNYAQPTLEYNGAWMGECSVILNFRCAVPIDFHIGDYIIYRNEKFVINYDPSVIKKARRNTHGEGFVYDNVKFYALSYELTDIRFLDYVLADNNIHYSSLPKFPFYAASIEDFCDRLQANTNRYCADNGFALSDYWLFVTPSRERTIQRSSKVRKVNDVWEGMPAQEVAVRWYNAFGDWSYTFNGNNYSGGGSDITEEKKDINVNIDNQSVWNGMALIKSEFGLNFVTRGRSVIVGAAGMPISHLFRYGKGNGLYEIDRNADQDQQIITKLFAYGSDKNLPPRYYANLGMECFASIWHTSFNGQAFNLIYTKESSIVFKKEVTLSNPESYFPQAAPDLSKSQIYEVSFTYNDNTYQAYVTDATVIESGIVDLHNFSILFGASVPAFSGSEIITFLSGVDVDKWPIEYKSLSSEALPNNMAVNVLMLPGFPTQSLYDWVKENGGTDTDDDTGLATWRGYTAYFSKDKYQPYILSANYTELGIREATKYWNGSEDTEEIYPTIEGTGFDVITDSEKIEDNGIFGDGEEVPNFHITLPDFGSGFDLAELMTQSTDSAVISMKDGFCGGRDFSIEVAKQNNDGTWKCECKRVHDDALDLWFPYSYNKSIGLPMEDNAPYQICAGDHYVLTGIPMTDTYILANAVKLLESALLFLSKNDYTRYTYTPKIDEIRMAYQHEEAMKAGSTSISIHDTIKEGSIMLFEDEDLNIDGSVFIDNLVIHEYGNAQVPTYEVTLRNDKQVGQIQRIQNKIDSLTSSGGGVPTDIPAVRQLIEAYGKSMFLSKIDKDTAHGKITFKQGTHSDGDSTFGEWKEDASGAAIHQDTDGNWHIEADFLHARKKLTAKELVIEEVKHVGGRLMLTAAECICDYVLDYGDYWRCFFLKRDEDGKEVRNDWLIGDQALMQSFNVTQWEDGDERTPDAKGLRNRYYWRLVIGTDLQSNISDFNDDFDEDFGYGGVLPNGVNTSEYHWIDLSKSDCGVGSDAPMAEDKIAQLGFVAVADMQSRLGYVASDEPTRRNAIMIAGSGTGSPYIDEYEDIDDYSLEGKVMTRIKPGDNRFTGIVKMIMGSKYGGKTLEEIFGIFDNDFSDIDQHIGNVENTIDNLSSGSENLLRNTGFTGDYLPIEANAYDTMSDGTPVYSEPLAYWEHGGATVHQDVVSQSGNVCDLANGWLAQKATRAVMIDQEYRLSFRAKGTSLTVSFAGHTETILLDSATVRRYTVRIKAVGSDTEANTFRILNADCRIFEIMLTEGTVDNADWLPSPLDNDKTLAYWQNLVYLSNAIANASTSILGGLILTQMIRVGNYRDNEMTEETGGMSGLYTSGNSPFLWGGGNMEQAFYTINKYAQDPSYQATEEEVAQMAKFVVTHGGRAILNDIILRGYIYALGGYFKGEVVAEKGSFKNVSSPNGNFSLDEDGTMSCTNAKISGSIYTPMFVIDESNYISYVDQTAGETPSDLRWSIRLSQTGLNVQINWLIGVTEIMFPTDRSFIGARVNILNNADVNIMARENPMGRYVTTILAPHDFGTFFCYDSGAGIRWMKIN